MCHTCRTNASSAPQRIFGAIVGMEPVVPQRPCVPAYATGIEDEDHTDCYGCGISVLNDDLKEDASGDDYCEECYDEKYSTCHSCDSEIDKEDCSTSNAGDDYCDECYNQAFSHCEGCDSECDADDMHELPESSSGRRNRGSGSYVCSSCRDNQCTRCADCREYALNDDTHRTAGGDDICQGCYESNYFFCYGCNEVHHSDRYAGEGLCEDCGGPEHDDDTDDCDCRECVRSRSAPARRKYAPPANYTYNRTRSQRQYGVELETAFCDGYEALSDDSVFTGKEDGSIDGKEFVSNVLKGDQGLDGIDAFCKFANDKDWTVDAKCGFHAHFDVSDLSDDQLKSVACAYNLTYNVWQTFVSEARHGNMYSGKNDWSAEEARDASSFRSFIADFTYSYTEGRHDRYQWLNLAAYKEHGTFESRIHSGTLNAVKVRNWILANIRFIDAVANMTVDEVFAKFDGNDEQANFAALADVWNDAELTEFYAGRAAKFGSYYTQAAGAELAAVGDSEYAQEITARPKD